MKVLNISADVTSIAIAMNGKITCDVEIYYRVHGNPIRKRALHSFNVSDLLQMWEK